MAQELQPITFRALNRGMADEEFASDALLPQTQLRKTLNMDNDVIGFLKRRKGYERLGTAQVVADNEMLGLHHHISTTAANSQIIAFLNNSGDTTAEAYYLNGSNVWTNKALGFTADTKVRATTFLNSVFAVNGTDNPKSWTGATGASWGSTNLTSAPVGSLIESFKGQLYVGSESTDTVSFSSIPSSGSITWTAADNFILNPNDGYRLRAMKTYAGTLMLLKDGYMYRFNGNATDAEPLIPFGTPSQEAVTVGSGTLWFYDAVHRGLYGYSGGFPNLISKPVGSYVRAVPTSNKTKVALFAGDDFVEAHLGDITVGSIALTNVSVRYTVSTQAWTIRSYAHEFRAFSPYDDGTTRFFLGGTTEGSVVKMDTGNSDLSTPISMDVETPWYVFGNSPTFLFKLTSFAAFVDNAASLDCFYKTDLDNTWRPIGSCRQYVNAWTGMNAEFHRIKFRFTGYNDADPVIFEGFGLNPFVEGIEKTTQKRGN